MLRHLATRCLKRPLPLPPKRLATNGRATSAGTRYFLEQSKLRIHHALKRSNLYINPIIVGKPMAGVGRIDSMDSLYAGAVIQNRSNCLHVYAATPDGPWHSHAVKSLIDAGVDREGLVTIADIGSVRTKDDIIRLLDEAWSLTELEYIDIAILQVCSHRFPFQFGHVIMLSVRLRLERELRGAL